MTRLMIGISCALLLAGCADAGDPAVTVERYFNALVAEEEAVVLASVCASYEATAQTQYQSFVGQDATLEDPGCTVTAQDGDTAAVTCSGEIDVVYDGAANALPLGSYSVVREGGEWRFCGETG